MAAAADGVAIITGGTSYLGTAVAAALLRTHKVAVTDLKAQEQAGRKLVAELGDDCAVFLECDVRSEASIAKAFKSATEHFGLPLTTLVNNAVVCPLPGGAKTLDTADVDEFDAIFSVNCRGAWLCTQAAARLMQPQRKGSIINIGTVAAINRAVPFEDAGYSVSKFALAGMTQVAAARLAPYSIRVNTVSPTAIADSVRYTRLLCHGLAHMKSKTPVITRSLHHLRAGFQMIQYALTSQPLIKNSTEASPFGADAAMQMTLQLFATLHPGKLPPGTAVGDAVEFFAGSKSEHITGSCLPVDQGWAAGAVNMPS